MSLLCERKKKRGKGEKKTKSRNDILIFQVILTLDACHTLVQYLVTSFIQHITHFHKLHFTVHRNSFLLNHLSTVTLFACSYFQQQCYVFNVFFSCELNWKHLITFLTLSNREKNNNPTTKTNENAAYQLSHALYSLPD